MKVCFEQKPEYFEFASRILDVRYEHGDGCKAMAHLYDNGEIAAVAIFSRFSLHNLEMSIATDGKKQWATRRFLRCAFGYPFIQLKKRRVLGVIEEDNVAAIVLDTKLGYVREGRLRKWFGDKDGILMGMLKEECVWIGRNRHE